MSLLFSNGKNSCFTEDAHSIIFHAGLIADEGKAKKVEIEEKIQGDLSKPRKVHNETKWKRAQDAVYWPRHKKRESHAFIAYKTVPPDCIERVISQKGETTLYQRLSTPRPALNIILKNAQNRQQLQQ